MKLDLKKLALDLDGKDALKAPTSLATILSEWLVSSPKGNALKYLDWAVELRKEGGIVVSNHEDYDVLYEFVSTVPAPALFRGLICREMKNQREAQGAFK